MSAKMKQAPAKRAKKKAAAAGPKMVLGWVAQAVPQQGQPAWDVVLIPEGSKTDFEKNPTVPGRWFKRIVGPATSAAAVKQARVIFAQEGRQA
jgi:glucose/arabinose dehydrogenase